MRLHPCSRLLQCPLGQGAAVRLDLGRDVTHPAGFSSPKRMLFSFAGSSVLDSYMHSFMYVMCHA